MSRKWFYRTLFSYIPVFFIVTAFLFFILIQTLNLQNKKETAKANDYIAQQALMLIDNSLKSIDEKLTLEIMRNQSIAQYFNGTGSTDLYLQVKAMNAMNDLMITNPLISSIYFVRYNDQSVLSQSTSYAMDQFIDYPFIQEKLHASTTKWTDVRTYREFISEKGNKVITLTRRFPIFAQDKGMVVVNVKTASIHLLVSELFNPDITFMHLLSRQGTSLLDDGQEIAGGPEKGILASYQSNYTGWRIETGINQAGFSGHLASLYNIWFVLGILAVLGALAWMVYITRKNYKPIELIVSRLQMYLNHKYRLMADESPKSEFAFIDSALENMIEQSNHLERQYAEDLGVKKKYFLFELLEGTRQVRLDEWAEQAGQYQLPTAFGIQVVFVIEIDKYDQFCREYSHRDQNFFKFVLSNVVQESIGNASDSTWNLWTASNQLTGIVQWRNRDLKDQSDSHATFEKIRTWVENNLKITVTIGVGDFVEHPDNLRDSFKEALEALQLKAVQGSNCTIYHDQVQSKGNMHDHMQFIQSISSSYVLSQDDWKPLLNRLFQGVANSLLSRDEIVILANALVFYLNRSIGGMVSEYQQIWKTEVMPQLYEGINTFESLREIENLYETRLEQFSQKIESLRVSRSHHALIKEIRAFIEDNFDNPDLSLDFLSERFGMNGKYFSKLFKDEFGTKFVDFLIDLRIRQAKELLQQTGIAVQEIAEKVGYTSAISFIRSFKKVTGLSPGDFRKEMKK